MASFRRGLLQVLALSLCLCTGVTSESVVVPAEPGDTVVLQCPGQEISGVAEFWQTPEGSRLPVPSEIDNYVANATTLIIRDVEEGHAGRYRCHRADVSDQSTTAVRLAVRARPYWQKHGTSLALAFIAAGVFLLGVAAICLIHRFRYEKRHKLNGVRNRDGFNGAHSNPALDVEAETHL